MNSQRWHQIERILHEALGRPSHEREAFIERECRGDDDLRLEVQSLLSRETSASAVAVEMVSQPAAPILTGLRLGVYEVQAPLGAGGMGVVYRALDTNLKRPVAIKFLSDELANPTARRRFQREAQTASSLNHPHIVTVHDAGEFEGRQYLVTEFVDGGTLRDWTRGAKRGWRQSIDLLTGVADGLAAAHQAGILHRDIKPENILITKSGYAKLADFGLAKLQSATSADATRMETETRTRPGIIAGTLAYMSPEQASGQPLDARSDIFSFGVVLYEMLAGQRPFIGVSDSDVLHAIIHRPAGSLPEDVPLPLRMVVEKALEKDSADRFQSMRDMVVDLRRAVRQSAEAPPAPTAVRRATRGRRWLAPMGVSVVVLVAAGALIVSRFRQPAEPAPNAEIRSIAVLPLGSLGSDPGDFLRLGVTADVITKVSQIRTLTVRPMSAVRKYTGEERSALEAARELGVDAVLDGTLQRDGSRVRVNVNLLAVNGGKSIWSDTFDVDAASVFEVQDRLSRSIASQLRVTLSAQESAGLDKRFTSSAEAYEQFLRGNQVFDQKSTLAGNRTLDSAIALFQNAVALDPKYALAHAQLAYCYAWMALFNDPLNPKWIQLARETLARSLALDPQIAQAHVVRYEISWSRHENFNIENAIKELTTAQRLDPTAGLENLGILAAHLGFAEQSLATLDRSIEIDPASETAMGRFIEARVLLGRYDEALAAAMRFNRWSPEDRTVLALMWRKDYAAARRAIEQALVNQPGDPFMLSSRALLTSLTTKEETMGLDIRRAIQLAEGSRAFHHVAYNVAATYAVRGMAREAIDWLRKTVDAGMPNYPLFVSDTYFAKVRQDPEWIPFITEVQARWERLRRSFPEVPGRP